MTTTESNVLNALAGLKCPTCGEPAVAIFHPRNRKVEGMSGERCETCRFYFASDGECRRRAPIFNDACGSIWPQNLNANDWCGEHSPPTRQ